MDALEKALADIFSKLPAWPQSIIDLLRQYFAWIILISSVLSALAILAAFGIASAAFYFVPVHSTVFMLSLVLLGLKALFGILGGWRMLSKAAVGWRFALYSALCGILANILDFGLGGIIGNLLMIWALFQIRQYFVADDSNSAAL